MAKKPTHSKASTGAKKATPKKPATEKVIDAVVVDEKKPVKNTATAAKSTTASKSKPVTKPAKAAEKADASKPADVAKPADPKPAAKQRGGFVPLVLGGVIAGGIGFGAATYLPQVMGNSDPMAAVDAIKADLSNDWDEIRSSVTALETKPDVPDVTEKLAATQQALIEQETILADIQLALGDIDSRLSAVEKRPSADGNNSAAITAFERDVGDLRASLQAQADNLKQQTQDFQDQLAKTKAEAEALKQSAEQVAKDGVARAALRQVESALNSGAGFGGALAELSATTGVDIPASLTDASSGLPTLADLQNAFPELARQSLAIARGIEGPAQGESGIAAFVKSQLGVRSLTPRDGDDADAVLSRAEFNVRDGNLQQGLIEISALPAAAQEPLADWIKSVEQRLTVISDTKTLRETVLAE